MDQADRGLGEQRQLSGFQTKPPLRPQNNPQHEPIGEFGAYDTLPSRVFAVTPGL